LIRAYVRAGDDLPTGHFIKLFRGFSSRAKAKAAREAVGDARRISEISDTDAKALLEVMQTEASAPNHKALGQPLGLDHMVGSLKDMYRSAGPLHRHWYSKAIRTTLNGAPAIVEAAIVEVGEDEYSMPPVFIGLNHSPTYEDPMAEIYVSSPGADTYSGGYGIKGFLKEAKALEYDRPHVIAVHIIAAAPFTTDFGKTRLSLDSEEFVSAVGTALSRVTKTITKEARARERDAARAEREAERRARGEKPKLTKAQACYEVLYEAYMFSTGNESLPTFARDLYYAVRNRIERFGYDADELTYDYFCNPILPDYRREAQELPLVEYEPRGTLYEPHDGEEVPIGTRAVAEYSFPDYLYNRILYIEKNGRVQILQAAGLDKKYDMALVGGQGFATEAIRRLFESAEKGDYQLFVLHDADRSGYGIARTLREETRRMPGYSVDVIDIGLKLQDALDLGKHPETHTAKSRLDSKVEADLSDLEREHFVGEEVVTYKDGKPKSSWIVKRVELNDLSSPQLVEYVESKLLEHDATEKVIPTEEDMPERAHKLYRSKLEAWVDEAIAEIVSTDELKSRLLGQFEERFKLQGARTWAATEFEKRDVKKSWREAVKASLQAAYEAKHQDALYEEVLEHLNKVGKAHADHQ
jgi:hypothetical protein